MSKKKFYNRSITLSASTVPLALLLLGVLTYGFMLPRLGFYWDDWAKISVPRLFGPDGYQNYYAGDRPLSAWTHLLLNPLLGETPLAWQIFQFGLVLVTTWAFYQLLVTVWPQARWQAAATALVFLVHPAFLQHAPAVTFHQQWLQYALILLSFWATLIGIRHPRWFWPLTGLAIVLSAIQLSVTEYFAPLELLRPLLIWVVIGPTAGISGWRRAVQSLVRSAPSLILLAGYVLYRLFFIELSGDDPYRAETLYSLLQSPLSTLLQLGLVVLQDSAFVLVSAWTRFLVSGPLEDLTRFSALTIAVGAMAGGLAALYLWRLRAPEIEPNQETAGRDHWQREAAMIGLAAYALGLLPAWITGREVVFDFHSDRYALAGLAGASLLALAAIQWLAASRYKRALLVGLLVAIGVGAQLRSANDYAEVWAQQQRFYWQLFWRAPYIEPGTALVTQREMFPNQGLFSSSAALNLLYPQDKDQPTLAYWWYALSPRYNLESLPDPLSIKFQTRFRNLGFEGSSQQALLAYDQPFQTNCVWLLSAADQDEAVLDPLMKKSAVMSDLSLIQPQAPLPDWAPPQTMFGPEPERGWCYFFEKAELYVQLQDWPAAAALGDEARQLLYSPLTKGSDAPREWQPFIRAYSHLGRWAEAGELSLQSIQTQPEDRQALCNLWQELAILPDSPEKKSAQSQVTLALSCK